MDSDEAKLILSVFRRGGTDANDPIFADALAQAENDPELGCWLAGQESFDALISDALQAEPPPLHLRDSILANSKLIPFDAAPAPRLTSRAQPAVWWALAAALAIFIGSTAMLLTGRDDDSFTTSDLVAEVLDVASSGKINLANLNAPPDELRAWLAQHDSPHDFAFPAALDGVNPLGCQTFNMDGNAVSLMCFRLEDGQVVHYFVINTDDLTEPPGNSPEFVEGGGLVAATWSRNGKTFVLTGSNLDRETLERLVA